MMLWLATTLFLVQIWACLFVKGEFDKIDSNLFYSTHFFTGNVNDQWTHLLLPGEGVPTTLADKDVAPAFLNEKLSKSYQIGVVLDIKQFNTSFDFFGQTITDKIVISTGGFLHIGDVVNVEHFTQSHFIAPLMGNFDFSLGGNQSKVLYFVNATVIVVEWRNAPLQEQPEHLFHFQTRLHKNGKIELLYKSIPINIEHVRETKHPVKAGISDAFYKYPELLSHKEPGQIGMNLRVPLIPFSEYVVPSNLVRSNTIVTFLPRTEQICNKFNDCTSCTANEAIGSGYLPCFWCDQTSTCSNGFDRMRANWLRGHCHELNVTRAVCGQPSTSTEEATHVVDEPPESTSGNEPEEIYITFSQPDPTEEIKPELEIDKEKNKVEKSLSIILICNPFILALCLHVSSSFFYRH